MMKIKILIIATLLMSLLGSCVTPKDTNLLQDIPKDYPVDVNLNSDYKIIPGDQLSLQIFTLDESMRELFGPYTVTKPKNIEGATSSASQLAANTLNVYSDGTVKIPYIGNIRVEGYTIPEINKIFEERFSSFSPNLTVKTTLQNRFYSILTKNKRGRYSMQFDKINIFQALAQVGTFEKFTDIRHVRIIRQTVNGTEVKSFDLRTKDIVDSEYYYIKPNDVIYVDEMNRTFFGRVSSFTGALGLVGLATTTFAAITLIVRLVK